MIPSPSPSPSPSTGDDVGVGVTPDGVSTRGSTHVILFIYSPSRAVLQRSFSTALTCMSKHVDFTLAEQSEESGMDALLFDPAKSAGVFRLQSLLRLHPYLYYESLALQEYWTSSPLGSSLDMVGMMVSRFERRKQRYYLSVHVG
jgi:hypothetical protein